MKVDKPDREATFFILPVLVRAEQKKKEDPSVVEFCSNGFTIRALESPKGKKKKRHAAFSKASSIISANLFQLSRSEAFLFMSNHLHELPSSRRRGSKIYLFNAVQGVSGRPYKIRTRIKYSFIVIIGL